VATKTDPPRYVACVVLATTRLDVNGFVRRRLGAKKVSFASAEAATALTGMAVGGVTAFGLPADVPVWVDAAVATRPSIILGGGSRRRKLRVAPGELSKIKGSEVVEGLANAATER
jgi:prolyl-tRNA editing enzyme YbaK/EbsC (Cys-tRNA(Pro) deacylase)